jgi:hypothetical protein
MAIFENMGYKIYILILVSILILSVILFGLLYEDNPEVDPPETSDFNKSININNELDNPVDIRIIIRNPGLLEVYNKLHYVNDSKELDNVLEQRRSNRVNRYYIKAIYDNQTESSIIRTSQCFGDSLITVKDDNSLNATYSVC